VGAKHAAVAEPERQHRETCTQGGNPICFHSGFHGTGCQPRAAIASGNGRISAPDYQTSRAIREAYAARLAKLEFEERTGKLLNADEVKVKHFNLARLLRDRIQQIPRKLAPQIVAAVVAQPDQRVVEDLLMEAIREALEELSR